MMFTKKTLDPIIDYNNEFKVVIGNNSAEKDELKIHQSPNSLKSLESFSRSSESLALIVTPLDSKTNEKDKRKKKSRSATRRQTDKQSSELQESIDYTVSRDQGESYMSTLIRNFNKDSDKNLGDCEQEKQRLINIKLESKLTRLSEENENLLREKVQIKSELETIQQYVNCTKSLKDLLEEDLVTFDRDADRRKINELEILLAEKQAEIQSKTIDFQQLRNDIAEYQDKMTQSNEKNRQITEDLNCKTVVINDFKKKISEFHNQLELTKLYRENSEYQSEQLQMELSAMKKARKWFEDQLKTVEETKDRLQVEVHRITNCLLESNHENEDIGQKNKSLEIKLAKFQQIKLHETTALLFELEQLQKEIMISEDEKRELEDQYSEIMTKYNEKIDELLCEQEKNRSLNVKCEEISTELEEIKSRYDNGQFFINELEGEGNNLRKNLAVLEDSLRQKIENLQQIEREKEELENNYRELCGNLCEKDIIIGQLDENFRNLKLSFDHISVERDQACLGIENLREEISKVEYQFDITRQSLFDKEQVLKLMEDLHEELKNKLAMEADEVVARDRTIGILKGEKNQLLESCQQFQQNNIQIQNELDMLRDNLNMANMTIAGLEDELSAMKIDNKHLNTSILQSKNEVERFKADLLEARENFENLSNVQAMYSKLFEDHKRMEEGYNELFGQHKILKEEYKQITGDLQTKLDERETELERIVSLKEEIVSTTQKDLLSAEENKKELKNELENLKFNHTVELATKEDMFREQLEKSSKEFSEMCQEKIRCETAIEKLQTHFKSISDNYEKKLNDCNSKILHWQQQSTAYAEFENRTRSSLEELAQKKGEIEAIIQIWENMKKHTEVVEHTLARQDADIQRLMDNHEITLSKKDNEIRQLKEKLDLQYERLTSSEDIKNDFISQLEERVAVIDQLQRKIDGYDKHFEEMDTNFNLQSNDYDAAQQENLLIKETQKQMKLELENKITENQILMQTNQNLLENLEHANATKEANKKVANDLQKEFNQKCNEVKFADTKHDDLVRGNEKIMEDMTGVIRDISIQNESLARKVELSQQQDIVMSAILNQLRGEVKKIIFKQEIERGISKSVNLSVEQLDQLEHLLDETREPNLSFRPQNRLTKCIDDLRTQIDSMQLEISKQIEENCL